MDLTPQTPDLNPTENIWDVLEKTLRSVSIPSSMQHLVVKLVQLWVEIDAVMLHQVCLNNAVWKMRFSVCVDFGLQIIEKSDYKLKIL